MIDHKECGSGESSSGWAVVTPIVQIKENIPTSEQEFFIEFIIDNHNPVGIIYPNLIFEYCNMYLCTKTTNP